jgi:hypothetical protein
VSRIELTQGAWAEVRDDVDRITNRERKRVVTAFDPGTSDVAKGMAVTDAVLGIIVTAWSFGLPLPRDNPESLDDIPAHDYDLLVKAATEAQARMFLDTGPTPERVDSAGVPTPTGP